MSRIAIVCTARPSFAKLLPVCDALRGRCDIDLIAAAYATTHGRSGVVDIMRDDGWPPTTVLQAALDANNLESSALTTGVLLMRITGHFAYTKPDLVIVNHDRHETIAVAVAASYLNIPVLHIGGGETSSSIDQKVRYANTALADWHCVSNADAYGRVLNAGAFVDRVMITGCPSIDVARQSKDDPPATSEELDAVGTGLSIDPQQPFCLVMMHPVTTHPWSAESDWYHAMMTAQAKDLPLIVFWPGADAGHDEMSKAMRVEHVETVAKVIRSLRPRRFLKLLSQAAYAVGNSSALIREASYFGIPRTILGDRQRGRAWSREASNLYGDGHAAPRIAEVCLKAMAK